MKATLKTILNIIIILALAAGVSAGLYQLLNNNASLAFGGERGFFEGGPRPGGFEDHEGGPRPEGFENHENHEGREGGEHGGSIFGLGEVLGILIKLTVVVALILLVQKGLQILRKPGGTRSQA